MISQMILPPKCLPTYITTIRPLISMCPFVYQQIVTFRKMSIAVLANKLFFRPGTGTGHFRPAGWYYSGRQPSLWIIPKHLVLLVTIAYPLVRHHGTVVTHPVLEHVRQMGDGQKGRSLSG